MIDKVLLKMLWWLTDRRRLVNDHQFVVLVDRVAAWRRWGVR